MGQSGPWSDGGEEVLRIPQSSSIARASPSDCLVSNLGHSLLRVFCILRPERTWLESFDKVLSMSQIEVFDI